VTGSVTAAPTAWRVVCVDAPRRATAYGVTAGWLYDRSLPALVAVVAVTQVVALALLAESFRRSALRFRAG
jgi:hypothetical protein